MKKNILIFGSGSKAKLSYNIAKQNSVESSVSVNKNCFI